MGAWEGAHLHLNPDPPLWVRSGLQSWTPGRCLKITPFIANPHPDNTLASLPSHFPPPNPLDTLRPFASHPTQALPQDFSNPAAGREGERNGAAELQLEEEGVGRGECRDLASEWRVSYAQTYSVAKLNLL